MLAAGHPAPAFKFLIFAACGVLASCGNLGYYLQSVHGHLELVRRSQPIPEVLADPATPGPVRDKLSAVMAIRDFATRELALPDNQSYRKYADLNRPFVVWNVFATPELSVALKEWCFPVAGCVGYRGYYSRDEAEAFAAGLREQGYEAFVRGVPAYSTLGWFDDPVLNTFIHYPDTELARIIFHELAHQVAYVKDDTVFNESFATAVEQEGMQRWLDRFGSEARRTAYAEWERRRGEFVALVLEYRGRLEELYGSAVSDDAKRRRKSDLLAQMKRDYLKLKQGWDGYGGYDRWFARDLTNAHLASVAVYTQRVPHFLALLQQQGGELPAFYAAVRELAGLPKEERLARLDGLKLRAAAAPGG